MYVNKDSFKMLNKEDIDKYLKIFANKYRKYNRNAPADIIIVGGSSIVLNYGFRPSTMDIDAIMKCDSVAKDLILQIAEENDLDPDWMNSDFTATHSYSNKLLEVSKHYKTYNNGMLNIRTVKGEYLIAMKMVSGRLFGNDLSDIIGVLIYERKEENQIEYSKINMAIQKLYGDDKRINPLVIEKVKSLCNLELEDLITKYNEEKQKASDIKVNLIKQNEKDSSVFNSRTTAKDLAELIYAELEKEDEEEKS